MTATLSVYLQSITKSDAWLQVPWKRLRMDVNLDAEYSDDAFPVALFSSQDSFYRSKKCVAARNLFRSKLPNTRSSVLSIVESWAASCNEIDRIFA